MITPLACTIVDWQTFLAIHDKLGTPPPTRQLDAVGMSVQSPASFLASIGGGSPIDNLRRSYVKKHTDLIHLIFAIESDEERLVNLHETRLTCINYGEITLLCGTLTQYMDAIIACSNKNNPLLTLMNAIYVYLDRGGFRECFYDYTRESVTPSTFTLKHR